jgi:hypothetical protein
MSLGNTNNYRMGNGILIYESTNILFNNLNITNQRYGFNNGVRANNVTISNIYVTNISEGVYASYGNSITIQNSTFIMTREAIRTTNTNVINFTVKDASIYQTRLGIQSNANYNNFTNILIDTFKMRGYYQVGGLRPLFENITIRNGGASISAGIQLDNNGAGCSMNNIDIRHIVSGAADIVMGTGSGSNCVINNITLINTTTNAGIDIRGSSNYITNVFMNKSIASNIRGINSYYYGVNNTFKNIQMYNVYSGFGSSFTTFNAKGMNVENIYINRVALAGFEMTGSMFNATIKNVTIVCGGGQYGIYITNNANISAYDNITSSGCINAGVVLHNSSNQNIRDINVSGVTTTYGALLYWTTSHNNTITRLNSQGNKYGVYVGQTNGDNWLIDSIINASVTNDIVSTANNKPANNYFLNLAYNKSKVSVLENQTLYFKWYVDVYVNYTNGTATNNATITSYDVLNNLVFNKTTNDTGYITRQNITEYYKNSTTEYYYTNYTFNATDGIKNFLTQSINITTNTLVLFTFTLDSCTPPALGDWNIIDDCILNTNTNINGTIQINNGSLTGNATIRFIGENKLIAIIKGHFCQSCFRIEKQ